MSFRRHILLGHVSALATLSALHAEGDPGQEGASGASTNPSVTSITIQGLEFEAPQPYVAGPRELTAGEASALNQTLAENLRNNFAPKIKAAMDAFRKANSLADDAEVPVSSLDHDALEIEFATYAGEYEFGVRKSGGVRTPTDPIERETLRIAKEKVKAGLNKKGIKLDTVSKEQMAALCEQVIAKYPSIKEEATRRVQAQSDIALDGLELPEASAPAAAPQA